MAIFIVIGALTYSYAQSQPTLFSYFGAQPVSINRIAEDDQYTPRTSKPAVVRKIIEKKQKDDEVVPATQPTQSNLTSPQVVSLCQGNQSCIDTHNFSSTQKTSIVVAEEIVKAGQDQVVPPKTAMTPAQIVSLCQGSQTCIDTYAVSIYLGKPISESETIVKTLTKLRPKNYPIPGTKVMQLESSWWNTKGCAELHNNAGLREIGVQSTCNSDEIQVGGVLTVYNKCNEGTLKCMAYKANYINRQVKCCGTINDIASGGNNYCNSLKYYDKNKSEITEVTLECKSKKSCPNMSAYYGIWANDDIIKVSNVKCTTSRFDNSAKNGILVDRNSVCCVN